MQQLDATLFRLINLGLGRPELDSFFAGITYLGASFLPAGIGLIMVLIGLIKSDVKLRTAGYAGVVGVMLAGVGSQILKHIWDRPRPVMVLHDARWVGDPLFVHSFPSGHTTTAFAFAAAVGAFVPSGKWLVYTIALAIGISRIYVGAHFPLDVLGGALLGVGAGYMARLIVINSTRKKAKAAEAAV